MTEYPQTLGDLEIELLEHSKKGRSDALFRFAIAMSQIGPIASFLTHDKVLNPTTRPYGSKQAEIDAAGHAILQVCTYVALRGVHLQDAVNAALVNLRTGDFIEVPESSGSGISGIIGCKGHGNVKAFAYVDRYCEHLDEMPRGSILVANHPTCGITQHQDRISGIITDNGGLGCHAAIVSREFNIACIVGTGKATAKIRTGDIITLDVSGKVGKCLVKPSTD